MREKRKPSLAFPLIAGLAVLAGAWAGLPREWKPPPQEPAAPREAAPRSEPAAQPPDRLPVPPPRTAESSPMAERDEPATADQPDPLELEKPAPEFFRIAEGLERDAENHDRLAARLDSALREIDWRDAGQARSMTTILQDVLSRHPAALSLVEAYLERDAMTHAQIFAEDPRPARQLMDAYLSLVADPEKQGKFILGVRAEDRNPAAQHYYESLYRSATGLSLPEAEGSPAH